MKLGYLIFRLYDFVSRKQMSKTIARLQVSYLSGRQNSVAPILCHAIETVPFYRNVAKGYPELGCFPVVNKDSIRADERKFISNKYDIDTLIPGKTSGSNGVPFSFYWCKNKALSRTAEVIFYNRWVGYDVGDSHLLNAVGVKKSWLKRYLQKEVIANPRTISDGWLARQRQVLVDKKIPFYIGYGSVIDSFTRYCEARGDTKETFSLKGIISTAEQLSESAKVRAEAMFGCPILRRYATLETGVLAHECPEERQFHVNTENYHIEFLKLGSDEPASPGEVSRVVVTDLHSYAMPLIRYDIGDLAIVQNRPCLCGRKGVVLKELTGRRADSLIGQEGQIVSWIAISDILWRFPEIDKFQVIQSEKIRFDVNLIARKSYDKQNLIELFRSLLGPDISVVINEVDRIDRLDSGKARFIVNEMQDHVTVDYS